MKKGVVFKTVRVAVVLLLSMAVAVALVRLRPRADLNPCQVQGVLKR